MSASNRTPSNWNLKTDITDNSSEPDHIIPKKTISESLFRDVVQPSNTSPKVPEEPCINDSATAWTKNFELTKGEADKINDPTWITKNLIIQGHLIAIIAEPNGGKTTIAWHIAKLMDKQLYQVFYVNSDVSGSDAKRYVEEAAVFGITLLLPDMKIGLSMSDVVDHLIRMNELGGDFSRYVFFFDTLKKMTDVIIKSKSKKLYETLRSLTAKGMTIIVLGHTNKYEGDNGKPIYEGTGDLRSDFDELIYLIPTRNQDRSMSVSTAPDKMRGTFTPLTFSITPNRDVSIVDYIDTEKLNSISISMERDKSVIEAINQILAGDRLKQSQITDACAELGISKRRVQTVLKTYTNKPEGIWTAERGPHNNALLYSISIHGD